MGILLFANCLLLCFSVNLLQIMKLLALCMLALVVLAAARGSGSGKGASRAKKLSTFGNIGLMKRRVVKVSKNMGAVPTRKGTAIVSESYRSSDLTAVNYNSLAGNFRCIDMKQARLFLLKNRIPSSFFHFFTWPFLQWDVDGNNC